METTGLKENAALVIVNDTDSRHKISAALAARGFSVRSTDDGLRALLIMCEEIPDIVLADADLPGINGLDLCGWIGRQERLKNIPVLLISDLTELHDRLRGYLAGARRYICKPFDMMDLLDQVSLYTGGVRGFTPSNPECGVMRMEA